MKRICIVVLVLAALCCALQADRIVVGKLEYRQVTVISVEKNIITFEALGQTIEKKLPNVTRIFLNEDQDFSEAERYRAEGEENNSKEAYKNAEQLYLQARKYATKDWHVHLIDYRLSEVRAKITPPKADIPDSDAPESDAWKTDPKVLGANIPLPPEDPQQDKDKWELLTDWQKRLEQSKYRRTYQLWQNSLAKYKHKKVTWVLRVSEIEKDEKKRGFIVHVDPVDNVNITIQFGFAAQRMLLEVSEDDWVQVEATIIEIYPGQKVDEKGSSRRKRTSTRQPRRKNIPNRPHVPNMGPGVMPPNIPAGLQPSRTNGRNNNPSDFSKYTKRTNPDSEEEKIPVTVVLRGKSIKLSQPPKWYAELQKKIEEEKRKQQERLAARSGRRQPAKTPKLPVGPQVDPQLLQLSEDRVIYVLDTSESAKQDFSLIVKAVAGSLGGLQSPQQYSILYSEYTPPTQPTDQPAGPDMMPNAMGPERFDPGMMPHPVRRRPARRTSKAPSGRFQVPQSRTIRSTVNQLADLTAGGESNPQYLMLQAVNIQLSPQAQTRRPRRADVQDSDLTRAVCLVLPSSATIKPALLNYATKRNSQRTIAFHIMLCGKRDTTVEKSYDEFITTNGGSIRNISPDGKVTVIKAIEAEKPKKPTNLTLFNNDFTVDNVVYVIDVYNGSKPYLARVKAEVIKSIKSLNPDQRFAVIAPKSSAKPGPGMMPSGGPGPGMKNGLPTLLAANNANRRKAIAKINKLKAKGSGNISNSLSQAIGLFNGNSVRGKGTSRAGQDNIVVLISNETIMSSKSSYRYAINANRVLNVPIHVFLLGDKPEDENIKYLKRIVDKYQGSIIQVK